MRPNWLIFNLRILFKYRLYAGISLAGLAIAVSSFWFIGDFVRNSHQYDGFHQNSENIYRLTLEVNSAGSTDHYASTGKPPGILLKESYPGISSYARLTFLGNTVVKVNEALFTERGFFKTNPETFEVFSFDFLAGDKGSALTDPHSVVLSRFLAEKYFNSLDIIGNQVIINEESYQVKGIFEDWPENSHLEVKALLSEGPASREFEPQDWFDLDQYNYVLLDPAVSQKELDDKLDQLTSAHVAPIFEGSAMEVKFHSQALEDLYFEAALIDDVPKGNPVYVKALTFVGLLVLLISGLNYINLSLTQSTKRMKEIAVKRILGITRRQIWVQSAIESIIMTVLVLLISGLLILCFDNLYFHYTKFHALDLADKWPLLLTILLLIFVTGLLGTGYSGMYLSFSGSVNSRDETGANTFKKILLGFQFVIASVILISTLTMNRQLSFMKNKDLGFSKEQVLIVGLPLHEEMKTKLIPFREAVKTYSAIENASLIGGGALPGEENGKDLFQVSIDDNHADRIYNIYRIDENYFELLNIEFVSGRNFQANRIADKNEALIINEILAKSIHWDDPIGKTVWYGGQLRAVIGVVKNFHNKSLHNFIEPIVFIYDDSSPSNLLVKTAGSDPDLLQSAWMDFFTGTPFLLSYFDRHIDSMYAKEDHLSILLGCFSLISLTLCCMGLFAVFSLHMLQKTKEMSIRKVLGASLTNLLKTATRSYLLIMVISIGIAIPIAWFFMNKWLNGFSYKAGMDSGVFICSALLILSGCCITLVYHVVKALNVNPVDSLKSE